MVYLMHIRGYDDPAQGIIQPFREVDIGVVELGHEYGDGLVQEDHPDGDSHGDDSDKECDDAEDAFYGMVPEGGGGIYSGVDVVNFMEVPHPGYFVLDEVNEVGPDQVHHEQGENGMEPVR